jgi:hypothetical protein
MQALYYDRESRPVSWQRWRQPGRAGHHAVTAWIAEIAAFLAGQAGQLPAPDPDLPTPPPSGAGQGR